MRSEFKMIFSKLNLLFIVGLVSILLVVARNLIFIFNAGFAEGTVIDRRCHTSYRGYTTCTNWLEYSNGAKSETFTSVDNLKIFIGQKVKVVFDKGHPSKAFVFSFLGYWWSEALAALVIFFVLFGIVHSLMDWDDRLVYSNGQLRRVKIEGETF